MKIQERNKINQLFEEFKNGNKEVLEEIYNKYHKTIYGIAFSILKNKDDSEDIVQSVFIKIHTLDNSKLPKEDVASWLYTLTKNEALQFLRKQKNNIDLDSIYDLTDNNNEIDKLINKETYNKLISKLNPKEKEIVSLKIISNLSFEEISQLLGEKIGTVKWRYYKSIYALRLLLSNLSMSIVTFLIGLATFKQTKSSENIKIEQDVADNENITVENNTGRFEDNESLLETEDKDKIESNTNNQLNDTQNSIEMENTIVEQPIVESQPNYIGIGFFSVSFICLILTIIFAIILKKHQLNSRLKSSK